MQDTTKTDASQVAQKLRRLTDVAAELEAAGVRIIIAEATVTRQDSILVSAHERSSIRVFLDWRRAAGIGVELFCKSDDETDLCWEFRAERNGVIVHGYLMDEEKDEWDKEDKK